MLLVALALAASVFTADALIPSLRHAQERHTEKLRSRTLSKFASVPPDMWFNQTLDHYNSQNAGTWPQRFWVNETFFKPSSSFNPPVFVYVEGEGAGSPADVLEGQHVELAAAHGALIVALEHRFYGQSHPTPGMSTMELGFLSSHQAIADLGRFIKEYLYTAYGLTSANRLITFGGSYPGALSAWARLRLPHLVYGSFSSSSPVFAQADFVGYNDVIATGLSMTAIGGSQQCLAAVQSAFKSVDAAMRSGSNQQKYAMSMKLLSCQPAYNPLDVANLVSNAAGAIMGVLQYNDDEPGTYDAAAMCSDMLSASDPVTGLATVIGKTLPPGTTCSDNSYSDMIAQLKNTTFPPVSTGVGARQWTYQTCTQFGYYQTCDAGTNCPFSTLMTLDFSFQQCQDIFNIDGAVNQDRINFTNDVLGGYSVGETTSRVAFINGGVDPWNPLSVTPGNIANSENAAIWVPTGAHCRCMFPSSANDPADVKAARAQAAQVLAGWLSQ